MEISDITIRLIVLSLPGIISTIIIYQLTVHKKISNFQFIVNSIMLGFLSYLSYQIYLFIIGCIRWLFCKTFFYTKITYWESLFDSEIPVELNEVLYSCIFGVVLAFILSQAIQNKWLNKFARKINVSNKYGDEDLYMYFLNAKEIDWVWVRDERNGYTYEGQVNTYSENDTNRELVLLDVKVYPYDSVDMLYEIPIMYLSYPKDAPLSIEVPNYGKNNNK